MQLLLLLNILVYISLNVNLDCARTCLNPLPQPPPPQKKKKKKNHTGLILNLLTTFFINFLTCTLQVPT